MTSRGRDGTVKILFLSGAKELRDGWAVDVVGVFRFDIFARSG